MLSIQRYFDIFKRFKRVSHFPLVIGEDSGHNIPINHDGESVTRLFILKIEKNVYVVNIEKELSKDKFSPYKISEGEILQILDAGDSQFYLMICDGEVIILRNKS